MGTSGQAWVGAEGAVALDELAAQALPAVADADLDADTRAGGHLAAHLAVQPQLAADPDAVLVRPQHDCAHARLARLRLGRRRAADTGARGAHVGRPDVEAAGVEAG